jgi:hypothetical protein
MTRWTESSMPAGTETVISDSPGSSGTGRRLGRPRGPVRVPLTVRVLVEHDERLTAEVAAQGLSPQYLVEQALTEYFARLDRLRGRAR